MNDKELLKKLNSLKELEAAGRPEESWVLSSREILMAQISPVAFQNWAEAKNDGGYYFEYFANMFQSRVFKPAVATFSMLLLFITYTALANVSGDSLPGDMFYPIKTAQEKAQLAFTFDENKQVELQMDFVSRRANELQEIVKRPGTSQDKKNKVVAAIKKISADTKQVKNKLNKISMASADSGVIEAAKTVDAKTLQVKQDITDVSNSLSNEVKSEISQDVNEAIKSTDDAGASALGMIVKTYSQDGDKNISESDVVSRVNERIKSAEQNIAVVQGEINRIATSTAAIASALATTTLNVISDKPAEATKAIEEAKSLLDQKDFNSALQKIEESKNIVNSTQSIVNIQSVCASCNQTGSISSTSTSQTSESTNQILK